MSGLLDDVLKAIVTAVANDTGIPESVIQTVLTAVEARIEKLSGQDTQPRIDAIKGLEVYANEGNAAAWQMLFNWKGQVGPQYPRGFEPKTSIADAQAAWDRSAVAHPTWAATINGPGGKPGDSPLDPNGPTLK